MTPQFKPGDYVRAVQITGVGKEFLNKYIMRTGCLIRIDDVPREWGAYHLEFGDGFGLIAYEVEPSTRADYDADWPEEEPEMSSKDHTDAVLESILGVGPDAFPTKTASAVLTAGNDHCLKYLRAELNHAERQIKYETERLEIARDRVDAAKTRENAILDLIAARMDQLKGNEK